MTEANSLESKKNEKVASTLENNVEGPVVQWYERQIRNQKIASSIPTFAALEEQTIRKIIQLGLLVARERPLPRL